MSRRTVILGAAESGVGAALLAVKQGHEVFVTDSGKIKPAYKKTLSENNIPFEEAQHTSSLVLNADEIIKSPGIPEKAEMMKTIRAAKIPVISEIEFASRFTNSTIIAITGTNGKSTTTSLTYHILKNAGYDVSMVGNIGKSFAKQVAEKDTAYYVMEISSFQLDDCYEFHPHVALILNISENHLDRYHYSMEEYAAAKMRITQKQSSKDYLIYGYDSFFLKNTLSATPTQAQLLPFSNETKLEQGAWIENDKIIFNINPNTTTMNLHELALKGKHNQFNSMAAGLSAMALNVAKEDIRESLRDFHSLEHRLEFVADVHGVEFVNDSKATTVDAVWYALESFEKPVIWIAGGVDKGNDYSKLIDLVKNRVKAIICLGKDNRKIHESFSKVVDLIVNTESAEDAVRSAYHFSNPGDVVLLSPACASFDLFENFEDRGNKFKEAVKGLVILGFLGATLKLFHPFCIRNELRIV